MRGLAVVAALLAPAAAVAQVPAAAPFALDAAPVQGGLARGVAPAGTRTLTLGALPVPVSPDGRFLIAFDRDAAPTVDLVATLADGRAVRQTLTVAPRAWRIERLDTLPRGTAPTEDFTRRRAPELAQIAAARAVDRASDGWRQRFVWPATGRISGLFGSQRIYKGEPGAYHGGVDVARPTGTPVVAPADGIVALAAAAPFTLEGNLLMIDHGMGLVSAFLHLSRIDVGPGDRVRQGQVVGAIGATGRATGPHLHWGMTWRGSRIDPLLVAGAMPGS
ncbi:peptidase [Sphingomonas sp. Leaf33]|uniref:M23 family metallopeptidase n=1 Tax=Sphingomonas sp. Leaf33 TaxID=1736215 RepID=UPI0006F2BB8D|nr:M23 family metallopeptidase [Sphingomonas sp. Leaf33]KQN25191.1 peptidase [Sphingomonas sp. Leaf33]